VTAGKEDEAGDRKEEEEENERESVIAMDGFSASFRNNQNSPLCHL
jgi:hypothetical protein